MKVPVRVYNHVSGTFRSGCRLLDVWSDFPSFDVWIVTKPMIPYDILWPVLKPLPNSARAGSEQGKVVEEPVVGKKGGVVGKGGMTRTSPVFSALFTF